jgi:site-specific recombinase XerC
MYKKGKQVALSAPQLSKLAKLMHSFEVIADQKIDRKVGKGRGDTNSIRTQEATRQVVKTVFLRLYELGFQVEDLKNIQRRHIEKLVQDWHASGVQPKTINNYISIIRKCCGWARPRSYRLKMRLSSCCQMSIRLC